MNKPLHQLMNFAMAIILAFGSSFRALEAAALSTTPQRQQASLQSGNVYYVSTTGRDTNSGSNSAPFRTFAKAVSVLAPGDTLQVMFGTYTESMRLTTSGTAAAPINVIGNGAVIDMQGADQAGIKISGNYINLSGFEVTGAEDAGIAIPGQYITVKNNNVHDNVTQNGIGTCGTSTTGWGSAIKVGVGGLHITIEENTVYNNCGEGIAVTRGVGVIVRNNTVYDNFAPNIYIDNSPFTIVHNNMVYCTGARLRRDGTRPTGIGLGEEFYEGWGAQLHDILIAGNTVRDCSKGIGVFASEVGGTFATVNITGNNVPSGQERALALSTSPNRDVVISYNILHNEPYISDPVGVTLIGNTITGVSSLFCARISTPTKTAPPNGDSTTPAAVNWYISSRGNFLFGEPGDIPVPADYNGDGSHDIAVFRPSNGTWYISSTGNYRFGEADDILVPGDYNGDRSADIAVYRPFNGTWYISSTGNYVFGERGDIPVPGDYNGDRRVDIAVFRPSNGMWYISSTGNYRFGEAGDIPVPGDYNGDCRHDIAVYRPSNGAWYISTLGNFIFGEDNDIPLPGDYNGDRRDDIAVYRPSNGTWYISSTGNYRFGEAGDIPLPGDYNGDARADIAVFRP